MTVRDFTGLMLLLCQRTVDQNILAFRQILLDKKTLFIAQSLPLEFIPLPKALVYLLKKSFYFVSNSDLLLVKKVAGQ